MNLQYIMNPNGGMLLQRVVEGIPSGDNLLEQIFSTENVHEAWKRVRANKGAAGIDIIKEGSGDRQTMLANGSL